MLHKLILISLTALPLLVSGSARAGQALEPTELATPAPVSLNESVRLDGKIIHLGDLFSNTGDKAGSAIAYTPAPGKRAIYDARWLYQIARAHKLNWRPLSRFDRIVVERSSTVIDHKQIAEETLLALVEQGADPDMEVEFSNRMLRLYVAGDADAIVGVEDSILDPRTNRFSAIIYAPAGDPAAKRIRVTGKLHRTQDVPVPVRRILAGEIIHKEDLKWVKLRARRLQNDVVVSALGLIGKSPRRGLRLGQPVRMSAVRRPTLVSKGSLVTIILNSPKMRLTALGKAVTSGSEGDVIQVTNQQSNKVIEAEVTGSGRVAVRPAAQLAMTPN